MSTPTMRVLMVALPMALSAWGVPSAEGASRRWDEVSFSPTLNDGLALTGAAFDGHKVLSTVALPFFEVDGQRYELRDELRSSGPQQQWTGAEQVISARYRVPTVRGTVDVSVVYRLGEHDAQYADLGVLKSEVSVEGPSADYRFYWRLDTDLMGAAGDRVQVYEEHKNRGVWRAPLLEQQLPLQGVTAFGRYKVRLNDGPDHANQLRAWVAVPKQGEATAWLLRAQDGEFEQHPSQLLNQQVMQRLSTEELVPQPVEGSDQVLWYQATLSGSRGTVGPELGVAAVTARNAVLEMDRMQSAAFPPASVNHRGKVETLQSAFATGGITITKIYYDGTIPDKNRVNMSELDSIMEANVTYQSTQDTPTQWFSWYGIAKTLDVPGVLGVMYDVTGYSSDTAYREGAFGLYDSIVDTIPALEDAGYPPQTVEEYMLWTASHETGHAYNQHHEDFYYDDTSCFYENTAIMGYSYDCANTLFWDFGPNSNTAMATEAEEYVRPGHGVDFISSRPGPYPYNTTRAHRNGHNSTDQFSGGGCP